MCTVEARVGVEELLLCAWHLCALPIALGILVFAVLGQGFWWVLMQGMTVVISRNNVDVMTPEQEIVVTLARQVGILHLAFLAGSFMTFMQRK